jgi:hypothetical protein
VRNFDDEPAENTCAACETNWATRDMVGTYIDEDIASKRWGG